MSSANPSIYYYDGCHYIHYKQEVTYIHRYLDKTATLSQQSLKTFQQLIDNIDHPSLKRTLSIYNRCQQLFGSKQLNKYHLVRRGKIHRHLKSVSQFEELQARLYHLFETNGAISDQQVWRVIENLKPNITT